MTASESASGDSPKAHYGKIDDPRLTADEMDERRNENLAYEYLCHLEEAKVWTEACIKETLPLTVELEESLQNGVYLAKLGHFMAPDVVPLKKVFDKDLTRYHGRGLHFRHTDNINHWLRAMEDVGLPKIFFPETTDIYDRKNMPRAIYCIHALSLYLFKLGKAPQIQDLYGKIKFTDEEISAMRKELDKYGIQMPTFSKIGGILANEMPVDEAALHAAVIAVNEAIDRQVTEDTVAALENPAVHLVNVNTELNEEYQAVLYAAKYSKAEIARNKSLDPDSSYVPDVYDELLTQAEIQGNINMTNTHRALLRLHDALSKPDDEALLQALRAPQLMLREVESDNITFYRTQLTEMWDMTKNNNEDDDEEERLLTKEELQVAVNAANVDADTEQQKMLAVNALNEALEGDDVEATMTALQNPNLQLPQVCPYAAPLYHEEFRNMKEEKQASLEYEEVCNGTTVLSAMAAINQAVDAGDVPTTFNRLSEDEALITNLDDGSRDKYQMALRELKKEKKHNACPLLAHHEVQQCVDDVNQQVADDNERILAVGEINEAIDSGDATRTLEALQLPGAKLSNVDPRQMAHYQFLLSRFKQHKATEIDDPSAVLWYEEIQNTVDVANQQATEGEKMSIGVFAINVAVESEEPDNLLQCLQNPDVYLHSVTPQCSTLYLQKLQQLREEKMAAGDGRSGWTMNRVRDGHKFYFNAHQMAYSWEKTEEMKKDYSLLTRDEIQTCLSAVTATYDRELLFQANEKFIVMIQSRVRGYLARKQYNERVNFMQTQLPAIVRLQAWWRMVKQKKTYSDRLSYLQNNEDAVIKLQAQTRMHLARSRYQDRLQYFRDHEDAVVKIQSYMRSNWAKKDYKALMYGEKPAITVVRRFVHLLDIGDIDYNEEIELQKLRQQVVTDIRSNQHLEADLSQMDIKIGLLVKNRITLQDVVSHHKSLKKYRENSSSSLATAQQLGLRAFTKQSRERLEAYQHLFYLLQTNPVYLAKLIFEVPQSRTTKFMESMILTLYNYASNQREEFLLLRLFETALKEEIRRISKVDKISDLVTGNPMVVKMIVGFNRNTQGQGQLRELLNPLVKNIINDRNLLINTNPVDIYKKWVNQTETETGQASGLPYDVTVEQALEYEAVRERIAQSIQALKSSTDMFLESILKNVDKIPYGMRYMAKVMREALSVKFPQASEKDILKIVGNLIYYRYINPAIVSPDAFDIIDVSMSKGLSNDQRRNLGSVAKILQFAASNKGFGGDSQHLSVLNPYIIETHKRFKQYFIDVCDVVDPDVRFNVDQYTDVTRVTKPVIYISLSELSNTHKLLLEHQDKIAPDSNDPLHELLEDLGDAPDIELLVGEASSDDDAASKAQMEKTEISLTLSNKFEVPEHEQSDVHSQLIRTKRMLVDVIRCQLTGDNLPQILNCPATEEEENTHQALIQRRDRTDQKAITKTGKLVRNQSIVGDSRLPLETMKEKIRRHLENLEKAGVVSRSDNYQSVINSIVQDIRNQRLYRQRRKQEMVRLRATLKNLAAKRAFFQEQVDYYNQYVKTCLDNLSTKGKKSGRKSMLFKRHSGSATKGSIKYSAAKLHEKGVILEIEGLAINQFKNVLFEISSTETTGVFDVNAKFMGVSMDKVELVFQDLLQLQYEGVAVMPMFDKAKINVNLLIFLLNKKFYGK